MTGEQALILTILAAAMVMFIWGRWRHDMIAIAALLLCVIAGVAPSSEAFAGFGHPAVITVACVLILSYGLQITGAMDALAQRVLPSSAGPTASIAALTALAALMSGFINNVGALALLIPVASQMAAKQNLPPGKILMPLAFGSILGGMTTMIGTPPNLIVSGFRAEAGMGSFGIFDFTPVGLAVTALGVLFVALVGWRLVPTRKRASEESFETGAYLTEVRVEQGCKAVGKTLREVEQMLDEADAQIVGMVRNEFRVIAPNPRRILREKDILVIEAEPESLASTLSNLGLTLEENVPTDASDDEESGSSDEKPESSETKHEQPKKNAEEEEQKPSDEIVLRELVVMPNALLIGRSATDIDLRTRYGINLLAISRQGRRTIKRLRSTSLKAGDVLLTQGAPEAISGFASEFGCVPLAKRDIRVPVKGQALTASLILAAAVGVAATGLTPAAISFTAAALAFLAFRIIPLRSVYRAVDWSVIVLLAALIPVAGAMATTGAADLLAKALLENLAQGNPIVALASILIITMTLSDFMNNAATAAVMCPIAISVAEQLGVNPDSFLMAVAIGASCAFLTPIGHQNNTLILGPGGFRFGDYWRLGLPLEILVIAVSIPMLLWVWPL